MIDPAHASLLVVDIQEKLLPVIHNGAAVVERAVKMVNIARVLDVPILVTEQYVTGLGPTVQPLRDALAAADAYRPIEKLRFSALADAPFKRAFDALKRRDLLVVGIETHICVLQTCLDAISCGYSVHVIDDATGSRNPEEKARGLQRLTLIGAIVSSVEMASYELIREARTPGFAAARPYLL